jgi:thymidylate synthase
MRYNELLREINNSGVPVSPKSEECRELMHVQLEVKEPLWEFTGARELKHMMPYQWKELAWYFSGERESYFIRNAAKLWEQQQNSDDTLNSNYGFLVFYQKQKHPSLGNVCMPPFDWAWKSLSLDKDSRRAVINYNTGQYNFLDNKDYICTQHQAFYIRGNKLLCYVALRSSDAIYGLPYNMVWWRTVYQMMMFRLKPFYPELEQEEIIVTIYSAHIYKRHYDLVDRMLQAPVKTYDFKLKEAMPLGLMLGWYAGHVEEYFEIQENHQ